MQKVSLGFSNWKIDEENQILYKVDSQYINNEIREKLVIHLKYRERQDITKYLSEYERCDNLTVCRAMRED